MNSFDGAFECDADAGVTVPSSCEPCGAARRSLRPVFCVPEPRGVNVAAAAAFGEMPIFLACVTAGCAASVLGVKEGDSTLKDFFGLFEEFQHVQKKKRGSGNGHAQSIRWCYSGREIMVERTSSWVMMSFNARIQLQGAQGPTFLKLPTKRPILAWCGSIYRRTVLKAGGTRWVVPPRISRHLRKGRGHIIPGPTLPKLDRWAERVFARGLVRDLFGTCVAGFDQDRRFLSIALRSSADV